MLIRSVIFFLIVLGCFSYASSQDASSMRTTRPTDLHSRSVEIPVHDKLSLPEGYIAYRTLRDLTNNSSVIAHVHVVSNKCELSDDGKSIYTRYTVEVLKGLSDDFDSDISSADEFAKKAKTGRARIDKLIEVVMPGGRVEFPDGRSAQVDILNIREMVNDHDYLLYLGYSAHLHGYVITGLSKGIFAVQPDGERLVWMSVTKTAQGYQIHNEPFGEGMAQANLEALTKNSKLKSLKDHSDK